MKYKIIVETQQGSEAYNQGIKRMVWVRTRTKKGANELIEKLKDTGINAWYEIEETKKERV